MHMTHNGSRHFGILSLLSLIACNDAQLKTLGELETGGAGGSAGATSPTQSSGAASGGRATESTSGAEAGAQHASGAGSGGALPNGGAGGSLAGAGGSLAGAGGSLLNSGGGTVSNAGTAGASIDACSNKTWRATATVACKPFGVNGACSPGDGGPETPAQAIDGDPKTRYTTGQAQDGTEEFVVAFASNVTISGITVDTSVWYGLVEGQGGLAFDFAIAFALEFSTDGLTFVPFSPPITGPGRPDPLPMGCGLVGGGCTMAIPFPPTTMKAIKFKQVGSSVGLDEPRHSAWWSIREFNVIACKEN